MGVGVLGVGVQRHYNEVEHSRDDTSKPPTSRFHRGQSSGLGRLGCHWSNMSFMDSHKLSTRMVETQRERELVEARERVNTCANQ